MAKAREKKPREIPKGLVRALATRKASADSEALLTDMIDVWGGTRQLALDLHKEFQNASPGSMTRQRILEMIQRLVVTNTTHQIGSTQAPSDMTDEELESTAMNYVRKVTSDAAPAAP
jgi:hypothetical protein